MRKLHLAKQTLEAFNPNIRVEAMHEGIAERNVFDVVAGYPIVECLYQGAVAGETPMAGVTPGVISCIRATEVIEYVMGIGELLTGRLPIYDGCGMAFTRYQGTPHARSAQESNRGIAR